MAIRKKEIEFASELDDVMILVCELIRVIKEGGEYTGLIDELIDAVNNINEIPGEYKENIKACLNTVSLRMVDIASVFIK